VSNTCVTSGEARFLAALPRYDATELVAIWRRATAAWPDLELDGEHFAAAIARSETPIAEIRGEDLYLATACCAHVPAAHQALDRMLAPARATAIRAGYDASLVDDALQTVRYRLLVATEQRAAKLETYRGRGSLAGWLRVVVLRQLHGLAGPRPERSDSALSVIPAEHDAALIVLIRTHGPTIRRMFREGLAALDDTQRALLRMEIVDALPHQQIAEVHGVHRTTIVRWIEDARATLAKEVRRRLKRELALGEASADSLLRALAHQVDLSLGSGLVA
jgi:RNA polymerase sigma-70 factor